MNFIAIQIAPLKVEIEGEGKEQKIILVIEEEKVVMEAKETIMNQENLEIILNMKTNQEDMEEKSIDREDMDIQEKEKEVMRKVPVPLYLMRKFIKIKPRMKEGRIELSEVDLNIQFKSLMIETNF